MLVTNVFALIKYIKNLLLLWVYKNILNICILGMLQVVKLSNIAFNQLGKLKTTQKTTTMFAQFAKIW